MVQIEIDDDVHARISAEASRRGLRVADVVAELADRLAGKSIERPKPTFVAAGASARGTTNRIDELLADGFGRT